MNTYADKNDIPKGLSRQGRKAAMAILKIAADPETGKVYTGGCTPFSTPKAWKELGNEYGLNSELIVIHDGGDLHYYFNPDYEAYSMMEVMNEALAKLGLYAQPCTCWYTAIYKI